MCIECKAQQSGVALVKDFDVKSVILVTTNNKRRATFFFTATQSSMSYTWYIGILEGPDNVCV